MCSHRAWPTLNDIQSDDGAPFGLVGCTPEDLLLFRAASTAANHLNLARQPAASGKLVSANKYSPFGFFNPRNHRR